MEEKKKKIKKPLGFARLIPNKCIPCGARCQSDCKPQAINMNEAGEPVIDLAKCTGCRRCLKACPVDAQEMFFTPEQLKILEQLARKEPEAAPEAAEAQPVEEDTTAAAKLKEYSGVWVYVEQTDGKPAVVSWELLGAGANLSKTLGVELCAVVIGYGVEDLCQEAIAHGATKTYLIVAPVFRHYRTEPYYKAICHLVRKFKPEIRLGGATGLGRDLAGAVATDLATGLTADCTGLDIDDRGFLLQTRPAFGGNIMATILTERTRPQMATVRPHVMSMPSNDKSRKGEIVREAMPIKEEEIATKVLEVIVDARQGAECIDVSAADVIVSGGRGMRAKENFTLLQQLADELGGVVGCSRAVVEAGWMPVERQVGQTGKTGRPKIYIACGIRGAIQHLVGMQSSDVIIAINRDKQAPIFEVATYGIVGDLFKIVPAITDRIKELQTKKEKA